MDRVLHADPALKLEMNLHADRLAGRLWTCARAQIRRGPTSRIGLQLCDARRTVIHLFASALFQLVGGALSAQRAATGATAWRSPDSPQATVQRACGNVSRFIDHILPFERPLFGCVS